jgi:hypothetical protein
LNRKRADSRAERTDTRAAMTAEGAGRRSRGVQCLGRDRQTAVARQKAGVQLCAVRADLPGLCQRHRRCVRPQIPGLAPGGLGPHRTSSGSPRRAFLRFPVCPPGSSPSSAVLWFPFVRRSPVRPLRPWPGSGSPSVSLRSPFPLSDLHGSAAARQFRRRWSRAAGTKVTSNAAPPSLDRAIRPHSRRAAAGHDGMPPQNRLLRAAASAGHRRPQTAQIGGSARGYQRHLRHARCPADQRSAQHAAARSEYLFMAAPQRECPHLPHTARACRKARCSLASSAVAARSSVIPRRSAARIAAAERRYHY